MAVAAEPPSTSLSLKDVRPRSVVVTRGWVFTPGDNPAWADPNFDDSAWQRVPDPNFPSGMPANWTHIGWFRLRVDVAQDLAERKLRLQMRHLGASEVFLDGQLVQAFGVIGPSPGQVTPPDLKAPAPAVRLTEGRHILAVRYAYDPTSSDAERASAAGPVRPGIACLIEVEEAAGFSYDALANAAFAGLLVGLGIVNLLFFVVDRSRTAHAALAGYAVATAGLVIVAFLLPESDRGAQELRTAFDVFAGIACACFVGFFSAAMKERVPAEIWIFTLIWIAAQVTFIYVPLPSSFAVAPSALYLAGYIGACMALVFARRRLGEIDRTDLSYLVPVMLIGALAPVTFFARRHVPEYELYLVIAAGLLVLASILIPTAVLVARVLRKIDFLEEELHGYPIGTQAVGSR
jgi:hypothetical protein